MYFGVNVVNKLVMLWSKVCFLRKNRSFIPKHVFFGITCRWNHAARSNMRFFENIVADTRSHTLLYPLSSPCLHHTSKITHICTYFPRPYRKTMLTTWKLPRSVRQNTSLKSICTYLHQKQQKTCENRTAWNSREIPWNCVKFKPKDVFWIQRPWNSREIWTPFFALILHPWCDWKTRHTHWTNEPWVCHNCQYVATWWC